MYLTPSERVFSPLQTLEQFEALVQASHQHPVLIFKHSPTCGTSAEAYDELEAFLHEGAATQVHLLNVLSGRQLSQAVAQRFAVRHESPQVLLLVDGQVRWSASHWRVTGAAVRQALAKLDQ
jgi:bacillithiol system protein YtxJ